MLRKMFENFFPTEAPQNFIGKEFFSSLSFTKEMQKIYRIIKGICAEGSTQS